VSLRGALLVTCLVAPSAGAQQQGGAGVSVAKVAFAENRVERSSDGERWERVAEGSPVRTGERLRTGSQGLAHLEFPWMRISMSAGTELLIPRGLVLSMVLDRGRIEILSEGDIIKLISEAAEVRGQGRAVVRRVAGATAIAAIEGRFRVKARDQQVSLGRGEGTVVASGEGPSAPESLPPSPENVEPGSDPVYVTKGDPLRLAWSSSHAAHHIQVLPIDSDLVLIDRDVGHPPQSLEIPWLGTFRWRVSTRDERGQEGAPSAEGLICVVDD
jgi:hypothetical protein